MYKDGCELAVHASRYRGNKICLWVVPLQWNWVATYFKLTLEQKRSRFDFRSWVVSLQWNWVGAKAALLN